MTIKEEIQIEEYKRTFAEAYKQGFIDAMSVYKIKPQRDLLVTEYPQDGEIYLIGRDKTEAVVMAYDVYKKLTEAQTKCYLRTSCDHYGDKQVCGRCREYNLYSHTKFEPQTFKGLSYDDDGTLEIEDEPQTECKMPYEDCEDCETHLKAQYGSSW